MIEVHLIGYTADLEHVVFDLDEEGGGRYRVAVDGDLFATLDEIREQRIAAGLDVGEHYWVDDTTAAAPPGDDTAPDAAGAPAGAPAQDEADRHEDPGTDPVRDDVPRDEEHVLDLTGTDESAESLFDHARSAPDPARAADTQAAAWQDADVVADLADARQNLAVMEDEPEAAAAEADVGEAAGTPPDPVPAPGWAPVEGDDPTTGVRDTNVWLVPPPPPAPEETPSAPEETPPAPAPDTDDGTAEKEPTEPAPQERPEPSGRAEPALSPAEIQALLRRGRSVAAVAKAAETDPAWIERWLPPILAERERIQQQAWERTLERPRLGPSADPLRAAVVRNLLKRDVEPEQASWKVARRADGRWKITVRFAHRGRSRSATWTLEPDGDGIEAASDLALDLGFTRPPAAGGEQNDQDEQNGQDRPAPAPHERSDPSPAPTAEPAPTDAASAPAATPAGNGSGIGRVPDAPVRGSRGMGRTGTPAGRPRGR